MAKKNVSRGCRGSGRPAHITSPFAAPASGAWGRNAAVVAIVGALVFAALVAGAAFVFLGTAPTPPPPPPPRKSSRAPAPVPAPVRAVPKGPDPSALLYEPAGHDHFAADALDPAGLLPLTAEFQLELYRSQNPQDCAAARYLVVTPGPNGLGSDIHVAGHHLMTAFTHGYVFLWGEPPGVGRAAAAVPGLHSPPSPPAGNRSGTQFVQGDPEGLCPGGAKNYECFFRPPSRCTLTDAIDWVVLESASATPSPSASPLPDDAPRHLRMMRERELMMRGRPRMQVRLPSLPHALAPRTPSPRPVQDLEMPLRNGSSYVFGTLSDVLRIYNDNPERSEEGGGASLGQDALLWCNHLPAPPRPAALPAPLLARLRGMGMGEFEVRSWVRAQTVGYLARLNDATLAAIRASRLDPRAHGAGTDVNAPPPTALPFPLPPGTVAAHVRHGDKSREMSLVDEIDYLEAAKRLVAGGSGDAPAVAAALADQARQFGVSAAVGVTARRDPPPPLPRLSPRLFVSTEDTEALARLVGIAPSRGWEVIYSRLPRLNEGPAAQMQSAGPGAVRLTRQHLGQLLLALEADAWVGTYASNWNRLVDELRSVWVPKAAGPYVEVGQLHDYQVW